MRHLSIPIIALSLVTLLLASCSSRQKAATLNDVETYIQERPDSALATIRAIDTAMLTTRSLRAHYALLHAMALDKNWIDTTDVNVVMPAVEYYAKHGTADQKMKAYYYLGRIYENKGDLNQTVISYTLSEDSAKDAEDGQFIGLLNLSSAILYSTTHQIVKALDHTNKALESFLEAKDTLRYNSSVGRLAMLYQEKQDWKTADSLYIIALCLAEKDTASMALYLSHYASMKVIQPNPDPQGAISLLKRRYSEYRRPLTLKDYSVLAYASALVGDNKTCDSILEMIRKQPERKRVETRFMEYRIAKFRQDYPLALELFNSTYADQNEKVNQLLNHSVNQTLEEYYENQAIKTKHQSQIQQLVWAVVLLSVIITGGIVLFIIKRKHGREKEEAERLIQLSEESNQLLKNMAADLENKVAMLESTSDALTSEMQSKIESLQQLYGQLFKGQFSTIADLCRTYLRTKRNGENFSKDQIYRKVKDMLEYISDDKNLHAQFEAQIDKRLDNIISHLKADLGEMSQLDERFLCYTIVGFDSRTIATLLGLSLANVYTKKSRLKDRIYELDSPYKEFYVRVI